MKKSNTKLTKEELALFAQVVNEYRAIVSEPLPISLYGRRRVSSPGVDAAGRYCRETKQIFVWKGFVRLMCMNLTPVNARLHILALIFHEHGHHVRGPNHDYSGLMASSVEIDRSPDGSVTLESLVRLLEKFNGRYQPTFDIEILRQAYSEIYQYRLSAKCLTTPNFTNL
jgi:hypothetical protein